MDKKFVYEEHEKTVDLYEQLSSGSIMLHMRNDNPLSIFIPICIQRYTFIQEVIYDLQSTIYDLYRIVMLKSIPDQVGD